MLQPLLNRELVATLFLGLTIKDKDIPQRPTHLSAKICEKVAEKKKPTISTYDKNWRTAALGTVGKDVEKTRKIPLYLAPAHSSTYSSKLVLLTRVFLLTF